MENNSIEEAFRAIPPITRGWLVAALISTVSTVLKCVSPYTLILDLGLVWSKFQVRLLLWYLIYVITSLIPDLAIVHRICVFWWIRNALRFSIIHTVRPCLGYLLALLPPQRACCYGPTAIHTDVALAWRARCIHTLCISCTVALWCLSRWVTVW